MRFVLSTASTLAVASVALGQEFPDPNPVPQADGTNLWYVGNNTQYPVIQDVLDAAGDGDEIVVRGGLYVESLEIDNSDLTIRPFVAGTATTSGAWEQVTFLNPTQGFNNDNGFAMKMEGGRGTYVGLPRQFTELSNGLDTETKIAARDASTYEQVGAPERVIDIVASTATFDDGFGGTIVLPYIMEFQSRSLDDVAIWSDSGVGTFSACSITSQNGLGGGIMVTGSNNQTMFSGCVVSDMYASGNTHAESGEAVCIINVTGDETTRPQFHLCGIGNNDSAQYGTVYLNGADTEFFGCVISNNDSRAADGTVMADGGNGKFDNCAFLNNDSGRGTFYWNAEGSGATDQYRFNGNIFTDNDTVTGLYGGVAWVDHASATGGQPQIGFSANLIWDNNDMDFPSPTDADDSMLETDGDFAIHTPYFPEYRIGIWNGGQYYFPGLPATAPTNTGSSGDVNGDGQIDNFDLTDLYELLGTCRKDLDDSGEIDFNDLLNVLVDFGDTCE